MLIPQELQLSQNITVRGVPKGGAKTVGYKSPPNEFTSR